MSFGLYLFGFVLVIGGVAWGLALAHVPTTYILIACLILTGLAILSAVTHTRSKDRPKEI